MLLKKEKTISSKTKTNYFVQLERPLSIDDFNYDEHSTDQNSYAEKGLALTLKQEIIEDLIETLNIAIMDSRKGKRQYGKCSSLGELTDSWEPVPVTLFASAKNDISYRGYNTEKAKSEHKEKIVTKTASDWETNKVAIIEQTIAGVQRELESVLNAHNETLKDNLHRIVVEQKGISNEWLQSNALNKDKLDTLNQSYLKTSKEIEKLQERLKEIKDSMYAENRKTIEYELSKDAGEMTLSILEEFKDEVKDHEFGMFFD